MGVTGNVESGEKFFTLTFNCHVLCKGGGGLKKKREKKVQHPKKTKMPKSSGKVRVLKGGKGEP